MGLLRINLFVISRSFKNPLCSKKGTVVGIVQNKPSLSQGMAQISDSRSILKPNRVISKHVSHTTTLCVHVLDTFKSSHHRLTEIRQPKPQLWRRKFWVLSNQACWIFSKVHPRPRTPWCHGAIATNLCVRAQRNTL